MWVATGAAAGIFVGMAIADRFGGGRAFLSVASRVLGMLGKNGTGEAPAEDLDEYDDEEAFDDSPEFDADLDDEEDLLGEYVGESVGDGSNGDESDDFEEDESLMSTRLDARVLRAYEQDPILAHRAIDIDEPEPATIVLAGDVPDADDAAHAETVARGVPGVSRVENQLRVRRGAPAQDTPST
jgi:hypothetical protein